MKRYSRLISIILCVALLISCMIIPASAAGDEVNSYMYFDFTNPGWLGASSSKNFTVYGAGTGMTNNIIYLICSRDERVTLTGYGTNSNYLITVDELWSYDSISCYRVKSNTSAAFATDFQLKITNSHTDLGGAFNVYKVFTFVPSGIVNIDAAGVTSNSGLVLPAMSAPVHMTSISSFPYVYQSGTSTNKYNQYFLDINIPISKFVGMHQGSFLAYANSLTSTHLGMGSYLASFSLLYDGSPIPFEYSTADTVDSIGGYTYFDGELTEAVNRPLGTYLSVVFDVPQQLNFNETYITARFIYICDATPFHFYFQDLYGRFSTAKTENELLTDIYNQLLQVDNDITVVTSNIRALRDVLHSDLSLILDEVETTNAWLNLLWNNLEELRDQIESFESTVVSGFNAVHTWLTQVGSNVTSAIASWSQGIIDAITGDDNGAAEEFKDNAQEQAGQVSDGIGKIDSVEKPDIGDIDANVNDFLDASAVGLLAGTINIFFQNNVFYSVFSLVLLMMLASYVLFGKK